MAPSRNSSQTANPTPKPVRIWPQVLLAVTGLGCMAIPTLFGMADSVRFMTLALGAAAHVLLLATWVLFGSRAPWLDRVLFLILGIVGLVFVFTMQDKSLGIMVLLFGAPIAAACLALTLLGTQSIPWSTRKWIAYLVWLVALSLWLLVGTDGMMASFAPELRWRWQPNAEERALLNRNLALRTEINKPKIELRSISLKEGDWPRFRGTDSNGKANDVGLELSDKTKAKMLWKQPVGFAWSSMIVIDGLLFTQEQRGPMEAVVCLEAATGTEVWAHTYEARYEDKTQASGTGPRSTPTYYNGKIYCVGGTGVVTCLSAEDGKLIWKRNLSEDCSTPVAMWGFATSPSLQGDNCFLLGGGDSSNSKDSICYDSNTGDIRWSADGKGITYSSPQLVELCNEQQVVLSVGPDTVGRSVADGKERWRIKSGGMGNTMLQPIQFGKDQMLIASGEGDGTSLVDIKHTGESWQATKKWSSTRLRPDFNDVVVIDSMILGLTKGLLTCVDSATGDLHWKKFRFGSGQLIALPTQKCVLVLSEAGELSIIRVSTKEPTLLTTWPGIQGKTWNHPVLVKNRIYCRSAEEMACYELE